LNKTFIDTSFIIASINQRDENHNKAIELSRMYENKPLVTTDIVLFEIGNALTKKFKEEYIQLINQFQLSDEVQIIYSDAKLFQNAFDIYKSYEDKLWSLVDCLSFYIMTELKITEALTSDKHFEQAGFIALMR